jgi:hypothetical protein
LKTFRYLPLFLLSALASAHCSDDDDAPGGPKAGAAGAAGAQGAPGGAGAGGGAGPGAGAAGAPGAGAAGAAGAASAPYVRWGRLTQLRDAVSQPPPDVLGPDNQVQMPDGGWWVTPIHALALADGNVLITGWGRYKEKECEQHHGDDRRFGVSFVVDPAGLAAGPVDPNHPTPASYALQPIDEKTPLESSEYSADVLYCGGHSHLSDGRILYAGGSKYKDLGRPTQTEYGSSRAHLFDPAARSFELLAEPMAAGPDGYEGLRWYPTVTSLPDGRALVTGGFYTCCQGAYKETQNTTIEAFDPAKAGADRWATLYAQADDPALRLEKTDYPHVYVLPEPVVVGGRAYPVAMHAAQGKIVLFDPEGAPADRFAAAPGDALRPKPSADQFDQEDDDRAAESTGLLAPTGEIMMMGGWYSPAMARTAHFYNPNTGLWRSIDTGISRLKGTSVLLPDGGVLLLGGYSGDPYAGDSRKPQIVYPKPDVIDLETLDAWPEPLQREYHTFAVLLKDGRILLGGGVAKGHDIGCEQPTVRIFSPPYLDKGPRPVIGASLAEGQTWPIGGADVPLEVSGAPVRPGDGVVLMALGAMTHAFDQNQRYVRLAFTEAGGTLTVSPPRTAYEAPPGDYVLFVVSDRGVPSVGRHVRIARP